LQKSSKSASTTPLRPRRGRFGTLLQQLECGIFGITAVRCTLLLEELDTRANTRTEAKKNKRWQHRPSPLRPIVQLAQAQQRKSHGVPTSSDRRKKPVVQSHVKRLRRDTTHTLKVDAHPTVSHEEEQQTWPHHSVSSDKPSRGAPHSWRGRQLSTSPAQT